MDAMETLGQRLKAARERKRMTLSQAALKTRVKIQHLEAMERDDFAKMPAPAYARGFIRLYCEQLGLDPAPIVAEYIELHSGGPRKPAVPRDAKWVQPAPGDQPAAEPSPAAPRSSGLSATAFFTGIWDLIGGGRTLRIAGTIVALILVGLAAVRYWPESKTLPPAAHGVVEVQRPVRRSPLAVMKEPPAPYVAVAGLEARP